MLGIKKVRKFLVTSVTFCDSLILAVGTVGNGTISSPHFFSFYLVKT